MNTQKSEYRIRRNRRRRQQQLQRRAGMLLLTVFLVLSSSLIFFSFRTKAQSSDEEVYYKYYKSVTVEAGDTLWDFAQQYCDSHYDSYQDYIDEVIHMNILSETESINVGQNIIVPYYSSEFIG